ncbi:phosphoglucosamine mutase [Nakamurella flavida]|uniref:Phosphoglucosamine mutase n=1 Tax=Nakamurella flavida TaxID=363630 RepID=A0A938YIR6_9ACTN|nr:phosphoglucosamine mutase [Nakamurella flavida]MBM9475894.1 phosphoglucosamine mutase [Nakamurella flavida]MBM9478446.1 phosphoglucosamine mutase [Nakamurella flavida]MDP9777820.1 phosphoglucosamine mutase [Nakamurella flavida]
MGRLFGTDGVRGLANADLTPELALQLATAAAQVLALQGVDGAAVAASGADSDALRAARPLAVVGRDPRASGEMLEAAVAAGLASAGVDVVLLGVLPTPAVAFLTADLGAALGVVISASHNAMPDNGIKIFAAGGRKLSDAAEDAIEAAVGEPAVRPTGEGVGRIRRADDASRRYLDHLLIATPNPIAGLKVVVDCAHGAASTLAPEVYRRAGAEVVVIAGDPDGLNINDGVGSTHLDGLRAAVVAHGADLGIAHDGDADRALAVAADGTEIDGDAILALLAVSLRDRGRLTDDTVVTTVMANIGFHQAMEKAGIAVLTTGVGDRYVLSEMNRGGYSLGGEQSGHFILADHATTGDGLLSALHLMSMVSATGRTLADLATLVTRFPQVLINVRVTGDKAGVAAAPAVVESVTRAEAELGSAGRVLLRPSGTEPLVRVMVEAATADQARSIAERVAAVVATV